MMQQQDLALLCMAFWVIVMVTRLECSLPQFQVQYSIIMMIYFWQFLHQLYHCGILCLTVLRAWLSY